VLALVVEDPAGGFSVCDSRDGLELAWRGSMVEAGFLANELNLTYTPSMVWPEHDTLVHEIVCLRVAGEAPLPLEALIAHGDLRTSCPPTVPVGPGWDHLYADAA
jgi:hypothetical protein